jgi:hypothetical protein
MVADSLRYWAQEMRVDGFRFDLATILAREPYGFARLAQRLECHLRVQLGIKPASCLCLLLLAILEQTSP